MLFASGLLMLVIGFMGIDPSPFRTGKKDFFFALAAVSGAAFMLVSICILAIRHLP